jgi:hypothetical protein
MKQSQTFGEQAARFSLYAPLMVLVIGIFRYANKSQPQILYILLGVNLFLVLAGSLLGIAALLSMRWYGRRGILVRAVVGVVINATALIGAAFVWLPVLAHHQLEQKLLGRWTTQSTDGTPQDTITLYLSKEGRFTEERSTNHELWLRFYGSWVLTEDHELELKVDEVPPQLATMMGKQFDLGTLQSVDANEMVFKTTRGGQAIFQKYH